MRETDDDTRQTVVGGRWLFVGKQAGSLHSRAHRRRFKFMKLFDIRRKHALPTEETALAGRPTPMEVSNRHAVHGRAICPPMPEHLQQALFGMGCFWGVERKFWQQEGVYTTAVGYAGGITPNPTYKEVCSAQTGHNEVVLVVYDPDVIGYESLLTLFWEGHDPTRACVRATMWAPSTAVVFTGSRTATSGSSNPGSIPAAPSRRGLR